MYPIESIVNQNNNINKMEPESIVKRRFVAEMRTRAHPTQSIRDHRPLD